VGEWTWAQLYARDPVAAGKFYSSVIGWEILPDTRSGRPNSSVAASGGFSRASIGPLWNKDNAHAAWLLLVRVADVKASVAKAVSLGGRVIVAPSDVQSEYWRAVVADPTGAVIGLVQLDDHVETKEAP
jgi:predicted enzyme related to lactoylglutathione lyase